VLRLAEYDADAPSESRNHAARYLNVFRSFLISATLSITPSFFHALPISRTVLHSSLSASLPTTPHPSSSSPPTLKSSASALSALLTDAPDGSHHAAGSVPSAHQTPLPPIARRSANVEPRRSVTGTSARSRSAMPAA
jgi:hypothetical protein